MAEFEFEVTQDIIDAAVSADKRFALIEMAASVAAELRDSNALKIFIMALRKEAEDAIEAFGDANIANTHEIMPLQVRVKALLFLNRTIEELMAAAKNAAEQLIEQDDG